MSPEENCYQEKALPCLGWPSEIQAGCRAELETILIRHGCNADDGLAKARLDFKNCLISYGHAADMASFDMADKSPIQPAVWIDWMHLSNDHAIECLLRLYALRHQAARHRLRSSDSMALQLHPAWEIIPKDAVEKSAILERWTLAGGKCYGEEKRMAAVKTSDVWARMDALTPPGRPSEGLPPFVYGWQCAWNSLSWAEAFLMAVDAEGVASLMKPRTEDLLAKAKSSVERFEARLEASLLAASLARSSPPQTSL